MNNSNKHLAVIINDLSDISKSALHHADLLAHIYKCKMMVYLISHENGVEKIKKISDLILDVKTVQNFNDVFNTIDNNLTLLIVIGLKSTIKKKHKEEYETFNRALEKISIPVVTIRSNNFNQKYKHIILPLDLTKVTTQKVSKAIELSKLSGGATINVLSVLFTDDQYDINRLTRQMIDVKSEIEKSGVECTAEIVKASPEDDGLGSVIVDYAHKSEADLIMIMSTSSNENKKYKIDKDGWEIITGSDLPVMNIIPQNN